MVQAEQNSTIDPHHPLANATQRELIHMIEQKDVMIKNLQNQIADLKIEVPPHRKKRHKNKNKRTKKNRNQPYLVIIVSISVFLKSYSIYPAAGQKLLLVFVTNWSLIRFMLKTFCILNGLNSLKVFFCNMNKGYLQN